VTTLPALTLWRPWAAAFTDLLEPVAKRIENRTWATCYRGPVALHAGQRFDWEAFASIRRIVSTIGYRPQIGPVAVQLDVDNILPPSPDGHPTGVVAVAQLVGICTQSLGGADLRCGCGPWAFPGQRHWQFVNVRVLAEPVPCKGSQQLWSLPADVAAQVETQIGVPS
jgi:hypothetical protein